ncbi:MAG: S10 family peptidase [Gemmatimonadales bacterium]
MRFARTSSVLIAAAFFAAPLAAQRPPRPEANDTGKVAIPKEDSSVTDHTITVGGKPVPYRAMAATMLLKSDAGDTIGSLYYTAYTRSDTRDISHRPITFIYNGGPGSASVWLQMGAFGPRKVVTTDASPTPPAPYQMVDNANSLIDVTDMVFIDPIGTGFSKLVGKGKGTDFWGVDEDAKSIEQFITSYVSRNGRWNSPKYLLGESYGTTRSAVLVNRLQDHEGMDFNGVVLISSVLDFETLNFADGHDISYELYLPSYAATAAYHKVTPTPADMSAFLQQVRQFAMGPYANALNQGLSLPADQKAAIAKQLSAYTGLSEDYLLKANLRVSLGQFMEELQRSKGVIVGRLDSRFTGPTFDLLSEQAEYDPQSNAITGAYTAAWNTYVRDELKYGHDLHYSTGGDVRGWNWNRGRGGWTTATYVGSDLAQALVSNPSLKVEVENGYYDLATPFFATEYTMDHLPMQAQARSRIALKYYDAGHMMYVLEPALAKLKASIAQFIQGTHS